MKTKFSLAASITALMTAAALAPGALAQNAAQDDAQYTQERSLEAQSGTPDSGTQGDAEIQGDAQMQQDGSGQGAAQDSAQQTGEGQPGDKTDTARTAGQPGDGAGERMQTVQARNLMNLELIGSNGETIGDVENVVSANGEPHLVVGSGGFMGLGEKQVLVPLSSVTFGDTQLRARDLTYQDVEQMSEIDASQYSALEGEIEVELD